MKSLSKESLSFFRGLVVKTLEKANISYSVFSLPIIKKRITLLKSPHVNKTAKEQFELKSYSLLISLSAPLSLEGLKFLTANKPRTVKIMFFRF